MVFCFRMELTNTEVENILDMKHVDRSPTRYTLEPGIYGASDNKLMLMSLLPDEVKVNFIIEYTRL